VLVEAGRIGRIAEHLPGSADGVECWGAALLPGLHDHHVHLLAAAAADRSVSCARLAGDADLRSRLRGAEPGSDGWVRAVEFDGDLDCLALDLVSGPRPTRLQHRSGAMWMVNSAGVDALDLDGVVVDGIERDDLGRPTGRLWRLDDWLRDRIGSDTAPDLAWLSSRLASYGVVGVTDATPSIDAKGIDMLGSAIEQRLTLLGAAAPGEGYELGPRKVVLGDHALPARESLVELIRATRPRPVAVHSVTRASLVLVLSALSEVGVVEGDRLEHAAVATPELIAWIAELGLTVVTQPSLVQIRGAEYLDRAEEDDREFLWPHRSLLDAGVRVGLSSDAPYGEINPWSSIAASVRRQTEDGRVLGARERVGSWSALRAYLTRAEDPGGPERRVEVGELADLVLLDRTLAAALENPADVQPTLTLIDGHVIFDARHNEVTR
jgi:predicted amidohydrolase YtcJ